MRLRIGIDFDNTIVSYGEAFHRLATERGLVPPGIKPIKEAVRDHLRSVDREDEWTELQGYVYGPGMRLVDPFPGLLDFLERCERTDVETVIVSHKTRNPYRGPRHDLHASAHEFLERHQIRTSAYFEPTKEAKLEQIAALGCTYFIDDLPEFLVAPGFPLAVARVLFDPDGTPAGEQAASEHGLLRVISWKEASDLLLKDD